MRGTPGRDSAVLDRIQRAKAQFEDLLGEHALEEHLWSDTDATVCRSPRNRTVSKSVSYAQPSSPTSPKRSPLVDTWNRSYEAQTPAWDHESLTARMTEDEKVRIIVAQQTEIEKLKQQVANASEISNVRYQELANAKLEGDAATEQLEEQLQAKDEEIAALHEQLKASQEKLRKERIAVRQMLRRLRSIEARVPLTCQPSIPRPEMDHSFAGAHEHSLKIDTFPELTTDAEPIGALYFTQEL